MPKLRCELFGHFIFAEELSYSALLEKETQLKEDLSGLFARMGFVHMHFTSSGDFLLVQGATVEHDQDVYHEVCESVIQLLNAGVEARLLFVDRFLDSAFFYVLNNKMWRESVLEWPLPRDALPKADGI